MTTIEDIKTELREIIELSDKATPAPWIHHTAQGQVGDVCTPDTDSVAMTQERIEIAQRHGERHRAEQNKQRNTNATLIAASRNLTPKMAKVILRVIDDLEKDQALDGHIVRHRATLCFETIRREWEVQA